MLQMKLFQSKTFLPMPYEEAMAPRLRQGQEKLQKGSGAGGEFTGWVDLPRSYDREELARIQAAASRKTPRPWWSSASAARTWGPGASSSACAPPTIT